MEKNRDISILEYFDNLQLEYLYYELRSKIYPNKKDREDFKSIMSYKKSKILDISEKNLLKNIFDDEDKMEAIQSSFLDENGNPDYHKMTKRDWYFYYKIGSLFSFRGEGVKITKYSFEEETAEIEDFNGEIMEVGFNEIKRIL